MSSPTLPFGVAGGLHDAALRQAPSSIASIEARLDRLPMTRHIWRLILLIACGGLFESYDLFMTGYVAPGLFRSGILTPTTTSLFGMTGIASFIGSFFTGLFIGTLLLSQLADQLGRRRTFTLSLVWYSVATAMIALQSTAHGVNFWRVVAGIGVGVQLTTIDTFISELVPRSQRGRAIALSQGTGFLAVPICALAAWLLVPQDPFGIAGWRFVVLIGSSGALFVWLIQRGLPESPRWLLQRGRLAEAEAVTRTFEARAEAELGHALPPPVLLPPTPAPVAQARRGGRLAELFRPPYRRRTLMMIAANLFQTVGFYGFANWVPTLLIAKGIHLTQSLEYTFIIAIVFPLGPMLGVLVGDRIERKWQVALSCLSIAVIGLLFAQQTSAVGLISLGILQTVATNWLSFSFHAYQAELFPTRIRGLAVGFVYSWSRLSAVFTGFFIAFFLQGFGVPGVFAFIAAAMMVVIGTVLIFGPRTSNRSLEEIAR
ncbi:MFS transporter [Acidisphaera sp. L21]|uniref:MFS transporter n=1 Tax=Acidisphaera sp. L21 TaxID=1641851 RepID=UPI00131BE5DF|nr:MFS transporter [Acidisphaera sp. L21]